MSMEAPVASMKSAEIVQDPISYANGKTCEWGNTPAKMTWSNGADEKLESLSAASSLSEFNGIDLPQDVPDGPQFSNLSAHIDSVVASLTGTQPVPPPVSVNGSVTRKSPVPIETYPNEMVLNVAPYSNPPEADLVDGLEKQQEEEDEEQKVQSRIPENVSESERSAKATKGILSIPHGEIELSSDVASDESAPEEEPLPLPVFDDFKPFAFFPTADTQEIQSDQWAWTTDATDALCPNDAVEEKERALGDVNSPVSVKEAFSDEDKSDEDFGAFEGCTAPASGENAAFESPDIPVTSQDDGYEHGILSRLLQHLEPALAKAFETSPNSVLLNTWLADTRTDVASKSLSSSSGDDDGQERQQQRESFSSLMSSSTIFWGKLFSHNRVHEIRQQQQWNKSVLYDSYLRSVNVDIRSAMPAFASQLRLLEPIRLGASNNSTSWQTDSRASLTAASQATSSTSSTHRPPTSPVAASGAEVCPAPEFDWQSSGLKNPLGAVTTGSEQLDLDFFEVQSEGKEKSTPSKDPKLSELELELLAAIPQPPAAPNRPAVQPIPNAINTATQGPQPTAVPDKQSSLSSTVRSVISKLPNLRYMRARNLIFPVPKAEPN